MTGYPGIKYNPNVRNAQQANANPEEQQVPDQDRKQQLGETLYPLIANALKAMNEDDEKAGKITGMVLELDPSELIAMIENPEVLGAKVTEALAVLATAEKKE